MSFAWVLNLDAELELARGRPGYVAPRKLLSQLAEHGRRSAALLGPDDVLLEPGKGPAHATTKLAGVRGRAWCPTPLALATLAEHGVSPEPHPPASVLRRVNHRLFAHELGGGLPRQSYVKTRSELEARLREGDGARPWLLKRPLTFAGRGQLRALGKLTAKQWTWVDASLERDGLIVEPLVVPRVEVSLHGFVWRDGRSELGRPCTQDVSERGTFRGVRLTEPGELVESELSALAERAERVARALFDAGYFGPFGIDAYRYHDGANEAFCALGEINARYTLAFTTGFPRHPSELSLE
jgi:hypothetical protein